MKELVARNIRGSLWLSRSLLLSTTRCGSNAIKNGPSDRRQLHTTAKRCSVRPFLLADIGEGITECQIVNWFVNEGDKVEQFDKICEVQSDKASVEPLVDIDTDDPIADGEFPSQAPETNDAGGENSFSNDIRDKEESSIHPPVDPVQFDSGTQSNSQQLLSPAVRRQVKTLGLEPSKIPGTGKDGRILKEDVLRYVDSQVKLQTRTGAVSPSSTLNARPSEDQVVPLSAVEKQMFGTMTQSLAIPQFLYTHSLDTSALNRIRKRANAVYKSPLQPGVKLTTLPFIMKAISQVFSQFPTLNAYLDTQTNPGSPQLVVKSSHNFGIAIQTPQGLLVPVVKNVQDHSIVSLAKEISELSERARANQLKPDDFRGATFIVSNIGSIGGNVVSPVIVSPMVSIVGIGRSHTVPAFDDDGRVVVREQVTLSWSSDHRVLDGATVATCAEAVASLLDNLELLGTVLR